MYLQDLTVPKALGTLRSKHLIDWLTSVYYLSL
jgi:hypothetical protein